jgi:pimeloyl-ACP methyl ester carboxylesterase
MDPVTFTRTGAGAPLLLLHGIGCSRRHWDPVLPALAERFDVIAVDLPGFGESAPLPPQVVPTPAALAARVGDLLNELNITQPHLVGNSLGGWVALELAGTRAAASLALLSPAGLWRGATPLYCRVSLRATRWLSQHAAGPLSRVAKYRLGRLLILGQTHGRPFQATSEYARMAIRTMAICPGFEATFNATADRCYRTGPTIDAPVTVAFGSRDVLLLPHQSRHLDQLPPGSHVAKLPGCGHIPMADDPVAVVDLITAATLAIAPDTGSHGGT